MTAAPYQHDGDMAVAGALTLGTDLALTHGGTGASTAAAARANLGLAIGSDVQAYDALLAAIAALATAADQLIYATGSDTVALSALTAFARTLLDDADAATARSTLGVGSLDTPTFAGLNTTGNAAIAGSVTTGDFLDVGTTSSHKITIRVQGDGNHAIEIGRVDGSASTPFLDWHAGATAVDYDFRFICLSGSGVTAGGELEMSGGTLKVSATLNVAAGKTVQHDGSTVIDANRLLNARSYTVATLPTAGTAGRVAFASDGRKNGEAAAAGTGVLVFDDGSAWVAVDTGTTVAA